MTHEAPDRLTGRHIPQEHSLVTTTTHKLGIVFEYCDIEDLPSMCLVGFDFRT